MKYLNLNIVSILKQITQKEQNCSFWEKEIAYEGGLFLLSSHTDNDYCEHTFNEVSSLVSSIWEGGYLSQEFQELHSWNFPIICELITDNGNKVSVFRSDTELFSCYHIGDKKIIKDDALWALSNLTIVK